MSATDNSEKRYQDDVPRIVRLSEALAVMTVSNSGFVATQPRNYHDEGLDMTVAYSKLNHRHSTTVADVQVKAVHLGASKLRPTDFGYTYDLDTYTYNEMAGPTYIPFFLALVVFPEDCEWLKDSDEYEVKLRCSRYLVDLRGEAQSSNNDTTAIKIRRDIRFDTETFTKFIADLPPPNPRSRDD